MNRLLIDLALADIDTYAAKKLFMRLDFLEIEDRAADLLKDRRRFSKASELTVLLDAMVDYRDAYDLEPVKQQAAVMDLMAFESLTGGYQSTVNAAIEQVRSNHPVACCLQIVD